MYLGDALQRILGLASDGVTRNLTNFFGARGTGAKDDNEFYNWPQTA